MSDLGTQTGGEVIKLGTTVFSKLTEAIMKLFKHLFQTWEKAPERRLTKERLKSVVSDNDKRKALEKLEGKLGYIKFKEMERAGVNCTAIGITMTKDEMQNFSAYCKREGLKFTATVHKDDIDKSKKLYNVLCPVNDLDRINSLIERMNDEKLVDAIDERIEQLQSKETLTEQDKVDIEALLAQKQDIQRSHIRSLNEEQSLKACETAVYGKSQRGVTLDKALDRYTGGVLDKSQFSIVADASDPTKYIKCYGDNATFNGKEYIKTQYEVYDGSKKVYTTDDRRFKGRAKDYWYREKINMKNANNMGDTFFKFYTVAEYEKWAREVKTQNDRELNNFEYTGVEGRDYEAFSEELALRLDELDCKYIDGAVVNKETGKANTITSEMSMLDKTNIAEAELIGKQIKNYQRLNEIESNLALLNVEKVTLEEGSSEWNQNEQKLEKLKTQQEMALGEEEKLKVMQRSINGVQSLENLEEGNVLDVLESNIEQHEQFYQDLLHGKSVAESNNEITDIDNQIKSCKEKIEELKYQRDTIKSLTDERDRKSVV